MVFEIILMWAIVGLAVVLFIRDEQRRRDAAERELAASYARSPRRKLAFEKIDATLPTVVRRPVLSDADLNFIATLGKPAITTQA